MKNYILRINAKCNDLCTAELLRNGRLVKEHDGYVPALIGGGDYVDFAIDLATGQILNWKVPSEAEIKAFIGGTDEDEVDEYQEELRELRRPKDNIAFDTANGIDKPPTFEMFDIFLCPTCSEAETRQPVKNEHGDQITAFGVCDVCETPDLKLFLYKITTTT